MKTHEKGIWVSALSIAIVIAMVLITHNMESMI